MAATPPPALPDDLVEEIFLRLPPDEPASLLRASLTSKDWGRTISSPAFRRRLHDFHAAPPVLGFLHNWDEDRISRFIPSMASSFSLAVPDSRTWRAVDFRHGRALFISDDDDQGAQELLMWEPITGIQRRVPVPSFFEGFKKSGVEASSWAAVFCAADGCDHRDCYGDPFGLLFVFSNNHSYITDPDDDEDEYHIWAWETGTCDSLTMVESEFLIDLSCCSSVLVGRSLLYFMCAFELILEYDLASHNMTVLYPPPFMVNSNIMLTKEGGLGVGEYSDPNLILWTKEANSDGTGAHFVISRVIHLVNLLPIGALVNEYRIVVFAEGTNTIFVNTAAGIFTVELQAEKARKVCDRHDFCDLIPIVSFYTPVPRGEHQDPPLLCSSEDAGGEVGEEKEKAIEQPQQLFDKGSNAIEEGDLVKSCFNHPLNTRIPSHGEIALECASIALLYEGKEMNDPLHDVSKNASNEESVTGTTSKDGAGNSKTSGSNVEDATPSQKDESKEVLRG